MGDGAVRTRLTEGQLAPAAIVADPLSPANARSDFNIGFSGYRFNGDIGAYTVRFRHYDPTPGMCRWLERDPAGYQDGPSLYSYLGRNPMAGTDPYGLALYSVSGDSRAGRAIKRRLAEIDASKPSCRSGAKREEEFGSEAEFRRELRINPDRREDLGKVGQGIGTAIETTASVLPGGGFATAVNEASQGNFGEAALNVVPGEKVAGLFVSLFLSKAVLVKFAAADPNKLRRIFGEPEHKLGGLVNLIGSEAAALSEIEAAARSAHTLGELARVGNHLEGVVNVRGVPVIVRGVVVDGVFRLGTAFQ